MKIILPGGAGLVGQNLITHLMQKVPIFPISGDGKYMRQPLYVGDFCNIIISCIRQPPVNLIYDITGREKIDYIDIIRQIKEATRAKAIILKIPYGLFYALLKIRALFDKNPPFTADQLKALVAHVWVSNSLLLLKNQVNCSQM